MIDTRNGLVVACAMTLALMGLGSGTAKGQWTSDTAANTVVCDHASNQNQPKVRATSNGGCYISWLDGQAAGWDVRLQRLNDKGQEQWAHNGVLVADLTLGSTTDYGLVVDAGGNAVLSFQDSRPGGTIITCAKIAPDGSQPWGALGVQVSAGNGGSTKLCATSDGNYVVAWTEGANLRRQKLDANGVIQWAAGGLFEAPPAANSDLICDVMPSDLGGVIISWSRNPARFLLAQRYGPAGAPTWNGSSPVIVFNNSSLQFGYFPTFLPDGLGGAVFGVYETGSVRNAYLQHISPAGMELFAHNGVAVSNVTGSRARLEGSVAYNPVTGDMFYFWTEVSLPVQSMWGVYGQKVDSSGVAQWGAGGAVLVPLSSLQTAFVRAAATSDGGAIVSWFDQPGSSAHVMVAKVDANGVMVWKNSPLQACSTAATKARLDMRLNACEEALMVWSDGRVPLDGGDIYAQNIHPDGEFGNKRDGDANGDGTVNIDDLVIVVTGWGGCRKTCPGDVAPINGCAVGNDVVDIDDLVVVITNWG